MRSSKGITLISLISSVILILILAATTIVTSTNAYNQMKFEGAKAEIEEVQKIVDEIATDYQTYKNEPDDDVEKTYTTYFKDRYGVEKPEDMLLSKEMTFGSTTVNTGSNIFYFSTDNLNKYFDLKGIGDVVVDFNTRKVYSVEGIKDPDDKTKIYYTASDWGDDRIVKNSGSSSKTASVEVSGTPTGTNGTFKVTLKVSGKIGKISEVYVGTVGADNKVVYSKSNDYTISESEDGGLTINVIVTSGNGNYKFKVVDELKNTYETNSTLNLN